MGSERRGAGICDPLQRKGNDWKWDILGNAVGGFVLRMLIYRLLVILQVIQRTRRNLWGRLILVKIKRFSCMEVRMPILKRLQNMLINSSRMGG